MEGLPLQVLPYSNELKESLYTTSQYETLEGQPAWSDFLALLRKARKNLEGQLLAPGGTLDKWGRPHDEEKRAVLAFINSLLLHTHNLRQHADTLKAAREKSEAQRARFTGEGIHGRDLLS